MCETHLRTHFRVRGTDQLRASRRPDPSETVRARVMPVIRWSADLQKQLKIELYTGARYQYFKQSHTSIFRIPQAGMACSAFEPARGQGGRTGCTGSSDSTDTVSCGLRALQPGLLHLQ